jgi:hypothetical protein
MEFDSHALSRESQQFILQYGPAVPTFETGRQLRLSTGLPSGTIRPKRPSTQQLFNSNGYQKGIMAIKAILIRISISTIFRASNGYRDGYNSRNQYGTNNGGNILGTICNSKCSDLLNRLGCKTKGWIYVRGHVAVN